MSPLPDLVPSVMMIPPEPHERRGFLRDDAAVVIDGYLRRLGSQESRCRRVLGRLASVFLRKRSHNTLGFRTIADYARERLGFSGSELRSLARVCDKLAGLPCLARAFEEGEISWSKLRLLVEIAKPGSEEEWLARAHELTVRELEEEIARAATPRDSETALAVEAATGRIEGEPTKRFTLRCSRRFRRLWRSMLALARKVTGENGPVWKLVEAIAAEATSCLSEEDLARMDAPREKIILRRPPGEGWREPLPDRVLWENVLEALPEEVGGLDQGCDGLPPEALDQRMRAAAAAMQRIAWQMGRLLRILSGYRLYRYYGYHCLGLYVRERLGVSDRTARALIQLDRASWADEAFDRAYRRGEIGWSRALVLLPVVRHGAGTEWVRRAKEVHLRRLEAEVEWALDVHDAADAPWRPIPGPPEGAALVVPEWQMCAPGMRGRNECTVGFTGPASLVSQFEDLVRAFSRHCEPPSWGLERMLLAVRGEWEKLPKHRDPVIRRDDYRCLAPCCGARKNLHDHHFVPRSHGGTNDPDNRGCCCVWHHLRGIHGGLVRAFGKAPDALRWELGVRGDGRPFLLFDGDRYVDRGSRGARLD